MTGIKTFEGFERKIKWKISQTRIKEEVRKDVTQKDEKTWEKTVEDQEELWEETARWRGLVARHLTQRPGCQTTHLKAWLLDNSLKGLVARQLIKGLIARQVT